jgi:hypothetical protein
VNPNLVERLDASWVPVKVHLWVVGEQQDMVVVKGAKGNNMSLHTVADIEVHRKHVVVICKGCDVTWNQSTHLQCGTSQVCPGQMVWV